MTHEPELKAAAYLAGELEPIEREDFEQHLLDCEECWTEVEAGRRGLNAVEAAREFAPLHLRDRIRSTMSTAAPRRTRGPKRTRLIAAAALLVVAAVTSAGIVATRERSAEPTAITAAVAGYTSSRLPGSAMPDAPAPDLSSLQLTEVGASAGRLDDFSVNAYAFRDTSGRRVMIYVGKREFPMPSGARPLNGSDGPWIAHREGIAMLCARYPHELLIVGKDDRLVHDTAEALDVM